MLVWSTHLNGKRKHSKVKLRIQIIEFEFSIRGPIWRILEALYPQILEMGNADGRRDFSIQLYFHLDRGREDPPYGDALSSREGVSITNRWHTLVPAIHSDMSYRS